jgi:hypothetical protein
VDDVPRLIKYQRLAPRIELNYATSAHPAFNLKRGGQLTHNWLVEAHPLGRNRDFDLDPMVAPADTNSLAFAQRCSVSGLDSILSDLEPDLIPGRSCPLREPYMVFRVGTRSIEDSAEIVGWIWSAEEELKSLQALHTGISARYPPILPCLNS